MKTSNLTSLTAADAENPVIKALAAAYRASQIGNTGRSSRDFSIRYEKLVYERAHADVSDERRARTILLRLESMGVVRLTRKPLARDQILSIFIRTTAEARFYELLNETPPSCERSSTTNGLSTHLDALCGHSYSTAWKIALQDAIESISNGRSADGLPNDTILHDEVLRATAAVLNNRAPMPLRRLSAEKLGNSKLLKYRRDSVERFMAQFLPPELASLEAWQVADTPPRVQLSGPLSLALDDGTLVGDVHRGPYVIADKTLARAQHIFTDALRCISIENITTFHEMASVQMDDLLVHTSYPSNSVIRLLKGLPSTIRLMHWGDTDPWGYDILRVLRLKTARKIEPLRMQYRPGPGPQLSKRESAIIERLLKDPLLADMKAELLAMKEAGSKGIFEQESLPALPIVE